MHYNIFVKRKGKVKGMKCVEIKTTKIVLTDEDTIAVNEAIKVVRELLNHMNKASAQMALRDPYTVEDNESIYMTEIEETIKNLEFIKDICEIV